MSEVKIILEFLRRKLRAIKEGGYSTKTCPITRFPMEEVPILATCKLLLSSQIHQIYMLPLFSRAHTCPSHAYPMVYVVEGCNY